MIEMQVNNPYMNETYVLYETLENWEAFLRNKQLGNLEFFTAKANTGELMTINPSNCASVSVIEVEDD